MFHVDNNNNISLVSMFFNVAHHNNHVQRLKIWDVLDTRLNNKKYLLSYHHNTAVHIIIIIMTLYCANHTAALVAELLEYCDEYEEESQEEAGGSDTDLEMEEEDSGEKGTIIA
jgi:hypothetical protein